MPETIAPPEAPAAAQKSSTAVGSPAASPSAPARGSTTTPTSMTPPGHSSDRSALNDAFSHLDAMVGNPATPKPAESSRARPATATPTKPASKPVPPAKSADKAAAPAKPSSDNGAPETPPGTELDPESTLTTTAPETPPATEPKPAESKAPGDKPKAPTVRQTIDRLKAEAASWKEKFTKLETEAKTPKPDPEKEALQQKFEATQKQLEDISERLRFADYQNHPEYAEKYVAPLRREYEAAQKFATVLKVTDPESGDVRQGLPADFDAVAQAYLRSPTDGFNLAEQLFGKLAANITSRVEKLQALEESRQTALNEFKAKGGERAKTDAEANAKRQQTMTKLWTDLNQAAEEKYPQWFKATDGDERGNELLDKGRQLADRAFSDLSQLPVEEIVRIHSAVRNKAAAFDRMALHLHQANQRIAELQKSLEAYQNSEPTAGTDAKKTIEQPTTGYAAFDAAIDRMARG